MKNIISGLSWITLCSLTYLVASIANVQQGYTDSAYLEAAFCVILSTPLWFPPINYFVNIRYFWE